MTASIMIAMAVALLQLSLDRKLVTNLLMVLHISDSSVFFLHVLNRFSIERFLSDKSEAIFLTVSFPLSKSTDEPEESVEGVGVAGAWPICCKAAGDDEPLVLGESGIEMISSV